MRRALQVGQYHHHHLSITTPPPLLHHSTITTPPPTLPPLPSRDQKWDARASAEAAYRVDHEYFVHLIMDNLPCATRSNQPNPPKPDPRFAMPDNPVEVQYEPGYRLGFTGKEGKLYFNNHLK